MPKYRLKHKIYKLILQHQKNTLKDFKKYYILNAPPEEVYWALTNPLSIQCWTGATAEMSEEPGSEFSLWSGNITGTNLAFETNKMIQQRWDFEGEDEESIVTIKLHPHKQGTSLELRHTNIPNEAAEDIIQGWDEVYMAALIDFF